MFIIILRVIFCIAMSIISSLFYTDEMSALVKRGKSTLILTFAIILSYMAILLPKYEENERLFDIIQIAGEFFVICVMFDCKFTNKLWVYLKLNIITGVGTAAGLGCIWLINGNVRNVIYRENVINQIIYYITVIMVSVMMCSIGKLWKGKKQKSIGSNIGGMELSVCIMAGMLCLIYSAGMLLTEIDNDIEIIVLCCIIFGSGAVATVLIRINSNITKREELAQNLFVLEKLWNEEIMLRSSLEREERKFKEYYEILNGSVNRMYLLAEETKEGGNVSNIISTLIDEKVKKARTLGIDISVKENIGGEVFMKPMDCVCIIANLFDNAIEAVVNQLPERGYINAEFKIYRDDFYCTMENTYGGSLSTGDGNMVTTKKDKERHGIGIRNVMETAGKYGRIMDIQAEEGLFRVEIR